MKILKAVSFAAAALAIVLLGTISAHAQTVPTLGTSDIAAVGGPIFTALIDSIKYVLVTFGVPLLFLLVMVSVFYMIYHKARFGTYV